MICWVSIIRGRNEVYGDGSGLVGAVCRLDDGTGVWDLDVNVPDVGASETSLRNSIANVVAPEITNRIAIDLIGNAGSVSVNEIRFSP
jgi:hypothetical protein